MDFNDKITWKDTNSSPRPKKPRSISVNSATKNLSLANRFLNRKLLKINSLQEIINRSDGNIESNNIDQSGINELLNGRHIKNPEDIHISEDHEIDKDSTNKKAKKESIGKDDVITNLDNRAGSCVFDTENAKGADGQEKLSSVFSDLPSDSCGITTFTVQKITKQNGVVILSSGKVNVTVKDEWTNIKFFVGMKVSIFPCTCKTCAIDTTGCVEVIDRNHNIIMIEDELISVTSLCTAFKCNYKPVLSSKILDLSFTYNHGSLVVGVIIHTVIEKCLCTGFDLKNIVKNIKEEIKNNVKMIYMCNFDEKYVIIECMKYVKHILSIKQYLKKIECDTASDKNEVEKKILSQKYGMRGIVDALLAGKNGKIITEIKTGKKMDITHKVQVLMYYIMMKDKFCKLSNNLLLFYAFEGKYMNIETKHEELMHILVKRNIITSLKFMSKNNIDGTENVLSTTFSADCRCCDEEYCKKITLMHRIVNSYNEKKNTDKSFVDDDLVKTKINVTDNEKRIIGANTDTKLKNNEVSVDENVKLCKEDKEYSVDKYRIAKWMQEQWEGINEEEEFERKEEKIPAQFYDQNGTDVILYVDDEHQEKANSLKEYIDLYNAHDYRFTYAKINLVEGNKVHIKIREEIILSCYHNIYLGNTKGGLIYKTMRYVLLNLSFSDPLLEKIVNEKKMPLSISQKNTYLNNLSSNGNSTFNQDGDDNNDDAFEFNIPTIFREEFMQLNDNQRSALYLSLNCKKYRLIHGYPGTGKSTLISLLIKILVHYGRKVLLITYTNLALENLLKKLNLRTYRAGKENKSFETVKQMRDYFNNIDLVAGTCYSLKDEIFIDRKFDFCIIDEASQQHLLLSLLPISLCKKFILVGDHLQLKPLTRKSEALKISLFEKLYEDASELKKQYRMGDSIMRIPNAMFYNNKMEGFQGKSTVKIIDSQAKDIKEYLVETFLSKQYTENQNKTSANIEQQKPIMGISDARVNNSETVVLCYYNASVSYIKSIVKEQIRVETIDRFQGSEADTVLVYLDPVVENEIMVSRERLNVALTRARKTLIIYGDTAKLLKIGIFQELFGFCKTYTSLNC